jgi:hypothetical protein
MSQYVCIFASASSSLFNYANIIMPVWASHVVKLCYIIVTSLLDSYCVQTCLLHLIRFYVCSLESSHFPVVWRGEHIHALIHGVSGVISSRHPSVIPLVYIIALAWYYKITILLIIHAMTFWKFLEKQDSLIDAVGKVWHCSVDRSVGTSLLLDSFITTDAIWRTSTNHSHAHKRSEWCKIDTGL